MNTSIQEEKLNILVTDILFEKVFLLSLLVFLGPSSGKNSFFSRIPYSFSEQVDMNDFKKNDEKCQRKELVAGFVYESDEEFGIKNSSKNFTISSPKSVTVRIDERILLPSRRSFFRCVCTKIKIVFLLVREYFFFLFHRIRSLFSSQYTRADLFLSKKRSQDTRQKFFCGNGNNFWWCVLFIFSFFAFLCGLIIVHRNAAYYLFAPDGQYFFPSPSVWLKDKEKITFSQLQFVSCNQHNLPQSYWTSMANAALDEVLESDGEWNQTSIQNNKLIDSEGGLSTSFSFGTTREDVVAPSRPGSCERPCSTVSRSSDAEGFWVDNPHHHSRDRTSSRNAVDSDMQCVPFSPPLDAFIWLGDIIYADKIIKILPLPRAEDVPPQMVYSFNTVEDMWRTQWNSPEYTAFRQTCVLNTSLSSPSITFLKKKQSSTLLSGKGESEHKKDYDDNVNSNAGHVAPTVWGVWDDHDMGINDGGKEFLWKNVTRDFLFNFLEVSERDPRRLRKEGVYTFHTINTSMPRLFSSPSSASASSVSVPHLIGEALSLLYENLFCVILLDVRSFRDPANITQSGDMLGEPQWEWLEQVLQENVSSTFSSDSKNSTSKLQKAKCASVLIGSGIQMFLDEKVTEHWGSFPNSRDRLLQLLRRYRVERVVFLSGDVHMGELGADFSSSTVQSLLGYPAVEGTSSGVTHSSDFSFFSLTEQESHYFSLKHPMRWLVPWLFSSSRRAGLYVGKNFASVKLEAVAPFRPAYNAEQKGQEENRNENDAFREKLKRLVHVVKNASTETTAASSDTKMQKKKDLTQGFSDLREDSSSSVSTAEDTLIKYRNELQDLVESVVNVTLTVFSLDLKSPSNANGRFEKRMNNVPPTVNRLSFPLGMLTYANGGCYENSYVNPHTGWVHSSNTFPSPVCLNELDNTKWCCTRKKSTFLSNDLLHYESTTPLPLLTRVIRDIEKLFFPHERMLYVGYVLREKLKGEIKNLVFSLAYLVLLCIFLLFFFVFVRPQKHYRLF